MKVKNRMTLRELKQRFRVGQIWEVTNHYITLPEHPCYGTQHRTILKVTSGALHLSQRDRPKGSRIPWPKADQIEMNGEAIRFFGFPSLLSLYLTFRPVE